MSLLLLSSGFISFFSSVPTLNLGSGAVHAAFLKWKIFSLQLVARFLVVIKASFTSVLTYRHVLNYGLNLSTLCCFTKTWSPPLRFAAERGLIFIILDPVLFLYAANVVSMFGLTWH